MPTTTPSTPPTDAPHLAGSTPAAFDSWHSAINALNTVEAAHRAGTLRAHGSWTPAQILDHLARFLRATTDGFGDASPPWIIRFIGRKLLRNSALTADKPTPKGLALPGAIGRLLLPEQSPDFDEAMRTLRERVQQVRSATDEGRNPYIAESPLFGPLTAEQWTLLHLKHFRHHLGFLSIAAGEPSAAPAPHA
ncbi:MAG: DUF1569 domain-containing protein [Phycisphaerales bacterium]